MYIAPMVDKAISLWVHLQAHLRREETRSMWEPHLAEGPAIVLKETLVRAGERPAQVA